MGSAFHQLCPRYSGTLTLTAPTAIRLWETFTFFNNTTNFPQRYGPLEFLMKRISFLLCITRTPSDLTLLNKNTCLNCKSLSGRQKLHFYDSPRRLCRIMVSIKRPIMVDS